MAIEKGIKYKLLVAFCVFVASIFLSGLFVGKVLAAENTRYADIKTYTTSTLPLGVYCIDDEGDGVGVGWDTHYIIVSDNQVLTNGTAPGTWDLYFNKMSTGTYSYKIYKAHIYDGTYGHSGSWDGKWKLDSEGSDVSTSIGITQNLYSMEASNYKVYVAGAWDGSSYEVTETVFFSQLKGLAKVVQPLHLNPQVQVLSLLPILIPLAVGFLALRKGLAVLQGILYQA